jgi:hypothetical protein
LLRDRSLWEETNLEDDRALARPTVSLAAEQVF